MVYPRVDMVCYRTGGHFGVENVIISLESVLKELSVFVFVSVTSVLPVHQREDQQLH